MKKEDKQLLLQELCARLPYGVIIQVKDWTTLDTDLEIGHIQRLQNEDIELKPYLRPLSSMTEEEDKERIQLGIWRNSQAKGCEVTRIVPDTSEDCSSQPFQNALKFLLKKHFDIFGLIPKGLAIAVTKENNPYDTKVIT